MTIDTHAVAARPGRPRDPACDAAILQATLDLFAESGYDGVTIERVAGRAGVGKATIYRRYSSTAELLVEAVRCGAHMGDHLPDTGDLRADLAAMMRPLVERLRGDDRKLMVTFAIDRVHHPDLAEEFKRSVLGKKREHVRHLVAAAVDRGDLPPDADVDLIAEAPSAILWHHALYDLPVDDDLVDRILDLLLP